MKYLPSEQEKKIRKAIAMARRDRKITLYEPCDCGWQIRHNNGGNYHERVAFELDRKTKQWYKMVWSTCEFEPEPEWEPSSWDEVEAFIKSHADWLDN